MGGVERELGFLNTGEGKEVSVLRKIWTNPPYTINKGHIEKYHKVQGEPTAIRFTREGCLGILLVTGEKNHWFG